MAHKESYSTKNKVPYVEIAPFITSRIQRITGYWCITQIEKLLYQV